MIWCALEMDNHVSDTCGTTSTCSTSARTHSSLPRCVPECFQRANLLREDINSSLNVPSQHKKFPYSSFRFSIEVPSSLLPVVCAVSVLQMVCASSAQSELVVPHSLFSNDLCARPVNMLAPERGCHFFLAQRTRCQKVSPPKKTRTNDTRNTAPQHPFQKSIKVSATRSGCSGMDQDRKRGH